MKFNRSLLGIGIVFALAACDDNQVKTIETKELLDNLNNPNYVIILQQARGLLRIKPWYFMILIWII